MTGAGLTDATEALVSAARLLALAAGEEAYASLDGAGDLPRMLAERAALAKEARHWLHDGIDVKARDKEETEDACARKVLEILGEKE